MLSHRLESLGEEVGCAGGTSGVALTAGAGPSAAPVARARPAAGDSAARRARRLGIAPPAALVGDWYFSRAVLAPSVRLVPTAGEDEALAVPGRVPRVEASPGVVGGGWIGYLGYGLTDPSRRPSALPDAVWGWTDHVLRLDRGGQWWFEAIPRTAS